MITPFIVVISIIGSYSLNNSLLDVGITIFFGLVGYWLRKMKYPLAPLVVALVLGDSAEKTLRQSLITSGGNPGIFFSNPLAASLMIAAILIIAIPLIANMRRRASPFSDPGRPDEASA
jgi:putative tricarboxylic transport membrane protein